MAIQAEKVITTIVVKGQDRASKEVRKAGKSVDGLSKQADRAKRKFSDLRSGMQQAFSGDVLGAVQSFKGALGGIGGAGGVATLAAGGVAALGVAAAASAVKLLGTLEPLERMKVQAAQAFAGGTEQAFKFADAIGGVTAQNLIEFQSRLRAAGQESNFTTKQLQNLANRAATVGKTGDEALAALAKSIQTGTTRALGQVGVLVRGEQVMTAYARAIGKSTVDLTMQERVTSIVLALQKELNKEVDIGSSAWAGQDRALAAYENAIQKLKFQISGGLTPALIKVTDATTVFLEFLVNLERDYDRAYNRATDLAAGTSILSQKVADGSVTLETYGQAMIRGLETTRGFSDAQRQAAADTAALIKQLETVGRLRSVTGPDGQPITGTVEAGGLSGLRSAQRRSRRFRMGSRRSAPQRATRSAAAQTAADIGGGAADDAVGFGDAEDLAFVMAQAKRAQEQAAALREKETEARRAATEARLEQERQLAEAQQRAIELERTRRMEAIDTASAITSAALNLGTSTAQLAKNDKLQRAILAGRSLADAARETALAAAAGAAGNYPKAIAHGLAAAAHGVAVARYRSAGKGGGGGAVRPSAGAVDQVARGADTRGGGNVTINAPPGFLIGTPAQLAAELRRLQLAGAGTGL